MPRILDQGTEADLRQEFRLAQSVRTGLGRDEYVRVKYEGGTKEVRWEEDKSVPWEEDKRVYLNLLRDSEEVRWNEVDAAVQAGEASTQTPK